MNLGLVISFSRNGYCNVHLPVSAGAISRKGSFMVSNAPTPTIATSLNTCLCDVRLTLLSSSSSAFFTDTDKPIKMAFNNLSSGAVSH